MIIPLNLLSIVAKLNLTLHLHIGLHYKDYNRSLTLTFFILSIAYKHNECFIFFVHNIMQLHNQSLDYEFKWEKSHHNWD